MGVKAESSLHIYCYALELLLLKAALFRVAWEASSKVGVVKHLASEIEQSRQLIGGRNMDLL